MNFFITDYLLGFLGLLATLVSGFLPPWVKRLAGHLRDVPFLGAFLRLVAPRAPAQALPLPPPLPPPPPLPDPIRVSLRQEDVDRLAAAISRGVNDGNRALVDKINTRCDILARQNEHLRRLIELQEQRPAYTYELVAHPVPHPPAAPGAPGASSG